MGPRSFNRGNAQLGNNGRVVGRQASMGPRSFNRGNPGRNIRSIFRRLASMGPRSFNRGNGKIVFEPMVKMILLQWGRGLSTAEIGAVGDGRQTPNNGFNGAAVFQPRKLCSRGKGR